MRITRVQIENFRSLRSCDIDCNNFNIIVGQNNHGKTNIFEAIEWLFSPSKGDLPTSYHFNNEKENIIKVRITFTNAQDGIDKMKNEANKTRVSAALDGSNEIVVEKISGENKRKFYKFDETEIKLQTGFEAAINDFLPKLEYVNTKQYYDSVAKYTKTSPMGQMLTGVMQALLEGNEKFIEFQDIFTEIFENQESQVKVHFDKLGARVTFFLKKQFPDTTEVKFEVVPPVIDDLLKNFETSIDDGIETSAEEKGDGMQRALMMSIIQTYAEFRKLQENTRNFIFLIDEAELHLHPTAQRNLKNALVDISDSGDQVFINTHSSVLLTSSSNAETIFKVEKLNKISTVTKVDDSFKHYIVFEMLGGHPNDLLFPGNFLVVEGISEFNFIAKLISRFYQDRPKIQVIPARGDFAQGERSIATIERYVNIFREQIYKDKVVYIADAPNSSMLNQYSSFISRNAELVSTNRFFTLPVTSLEEYFPNSNGWKKSTVEVAAMDGLSKIRLADEVATNITQQQFESEMTLIYNALAKAWELCYIF